jgi:SAM-dependent methyltransferase
MSPYDPAAYGDAWSHDYDRLFDVREDPTVIVEALGRMAMGRSVLELGIGTGRLAVPLHDAGWRVVGVEASDAMVAALRERAGARDIAVHRGDMRSVHLDDRFDVVLVAFSTLFLLPDQESQVDCLASAAYHLAPGGRVVIEAFVPDHTRWAGGKRLALSRWEGEGIEIEAARHDRAAQVIEVRYVALGDGDVRVRPLRLRYAWPAEIDLMARLAGLGLVDRWADWLGTPFGAASSGQVSVYLNDGSGEP